jgi:hypothetical protein
MLDARAAADAICRQAELLIPLQGFTSDAIIVCQSRSRGRDWHDRPISGWRAAKARRYPLLPPLVEVISALAGD